MKKRKTKPHSSRSAIPWQREKQARGYGYYVLDEGTGLKRTWRVYRKSDGFLLATIYTGSGNVLFHFGNYEKQIAEDAAHALLIVRRMEEKHFQTA